MLHLSPELQLKRNTSGSHEFSLRRDPLAWARWFIAQNENTRSRHCPNMHQIDFTYQTTVQGIPCNHSSTQAIQTRGKVGNRQIYAKYKKP